VHRRGDARATQRTGSRPAPAPSDPRGGGSLSSYPVDLPGLRIAPDAKTVSALPATP
jgi:hypothetical protein